MATPKTRNGRLKRWVYRLLKALAVVVVAIVIARLAFPLPDISKRPAESALAARPSDALVRRATTAHGGLADKSGVAMLNDGRDAFGSRLALIDRAQTSIDAQYYIWHDDNSGMLLLDALQRAARRGVRVRLLLDDNGVPGMDDLLAALNSEPNIRIRLFNPSTVRRPKMLGYTFDFFRMNRRMHNKALIVDGAAAIVGGRNIGDEYFEFGEAYYKDMDVLAVGPIVVDTSAAFDRYWNSASVFALEKIVPGRGDGAMLATRIAAVRQREDPYFAIAGTANTVTRYAEDGQPLEWTRVQLVADDPIKGQGKARDDQLMIARLGSILGTVNKRLDLVSAYFVPGETGSLYFEKLAGAGKDVRILTNAFDTTDVVLVHSGYAKYRRELLKNGVKLYELRLRGEALGGKDQQVHPLGISGASLHAKTFAVDQSRVFIGSFNFDPRSARLNCEMGYLIDSPAMAQRISAPFDGPLNMASYRPELGNQGDMAWRERSVRGEEALRTPEPGTSWTERAMLKVVGWLPVEWLL